MHHKRLLTAVFAVPILYFAIMHLPAYVFLCMLITFSSLALFEFYAMSGIAGPLRYAGIGLGILQLAIFFFARDRYYDLLILSVLAVTGLRLFIKGDPASSLSDASLSVMGLFYIPCLLSCQLDLVRTDPALIIMLYSSVWAADSSAYYVGKGIGKRKLYESISPNKTVAGAVGSVIGGVIGASVIRTALLTSMPLPVAMAAGASIGTATIVGDLVESMFKRDAGVKDSGGIIPGHGGVLDKIDGVTFAGPVFYWICKGSGIVG